MVYWRCFSNWLERRGPGRRIVFLGILLAVGAGEVWAATHTGTAATSRPTDVCRIQDLRLYTGGAVLTFETPTNHYLIVQFSERITSAFRPVWAGWPSVHGTVAVPLPRAGARTAGFFCGQAIDGASPADSDSDGIDDVYEMLRSDVMDPLDPFDALEDADFDGLLNLDEYLSGTESAFPKSAAAQGFSTLSDLRQQPDAPLPGLIHLGGYESDGDGWGGWFTWDPDDGRPFDDAIRIQLRPNRPGRLERLLQPDSEINVAWWRPASDGSKDVTESLQAAFDFLSTRETKRLLIPPGRYRTDAQVTLEDSKRARLRLDGVADFTIDGTGATLFSPTDGDILLLKDCVRGTVRGLAFEGSGSDRGIADFNYAAVQLAGICQDLLFNRCRVTQFMHGISHLHGEKTSTRITVRECYFEDGGDTRHGFQGVDGSAISGVGNDWVIENNVIHECARGIELENTTKTNTITRAIVRGNRLTNVRSTGIMAFMGDIVIAEPQQSDILVRDNIVIGKSPRHPSANQPFLPIMGINLSGGSRWLVQGNICDIGDYAGISLYATQANINDSVVSDNVVTRMTGRGIQILASTNHLTEGLIVSGNRIRSCGDRGLLITGVRMNAFGNLIEDTGVAGISIGSADQPTVATSDVLLRGNVLRSMRGQSPAILILSSASGVVVTGNDIADALVGIRRIALDTVITNNFFTRVARPVVTDTSTESDTNSAKGAAKGPVP
ncbi:MAG: right-handed parallel beta-helix repeat-containing protein [Verrucomicrobiales bacterium]|nr:right-handed parallel beta-helix repeat-containing protein [Verrucomicrobiales bacterium]